MKVLTGCRPRQSNAYEADSSNVNDGNSEVRSNRTTTTTTLILRVTLQDPSVVAAKLFKDR